ncbi:MAG: histidinol-phosphate aminotransferase family protein [Chloroflexales bacterium]|nr:histidinol-phosphate aminotransferase family protein [Chloroflexales bacterium]
MFLPWGATILLRSRLQGVLPGNGANELIHLLARAMLAPGETALVAGPTYGEYAQACRLAGARVVERRASEAAGFALDIDALAQTVESVRPRLTWLCAPNNPTGADLAPGQARALADLCAAHGGLLVLDQAYAGFARGHGPHDDAPDQGRAHGLLRLHSLTKSYALAGLRLGYLLGEPALIERVAAYQPAWSVSSAAQAAGLAALADESFLRETLPRLWAASDALLAGLRALGLTVRRDALPFLLVRTGDAAATRAALLAHGCVVRDCSSFGLPAWVRVAPRRPEENARLLEAWRELP